MKYKELRKRDLDKLYDELRIGVDPTMPGEDRTTYTDGPFSKVIIERCNPWWEHFSARLEQERPTVDRVKLYNYRIKGQPDNPEPISAHEYIPKLEFTEPRWIDAPEHYRVLCVPYDVFTRDYRRVGENGEDAAVGEMPVMIVRKDGKRFREAAWYPRELVKQYQGELIVFLEEM